MKNRTLCIKSVKLGMMVYIIGLNIFIYGGVAPVTSGGATYSLACLSIIYCLENFSLEWQYSLKL